MKKKLIVFAFAIIPAFVLSACNSMFEKEVEPLPVQEFTHLRDKIKPYTDSEQTTFVDFDGTELETQISRGSRVEFTKDEPTRKSSKKYDYKFKEWGQVFDKETKTTVVKAYIPKTCSQFINATYEYTFGTDYRYKLWVYTNFANKEEMKEQNNAFWYWTDDVSITYNVNEW